MTKRIFEVAFIKTVLLELDSAVIDAVDDAWRKDLYNLNAPEEIAEMIGRCMILFQSELSHLDGWANQPNENARIIKDIDEETEAKEIYEN
jgi:hypothetical protein